MLFIYFLFLEKKLCQRMKLYEAEFGSLYDHEISEKFSPMIDKTLKQNTCIFILAHLYDKKCYMHFSVNSSII